MSLRDRAIAAVPWAFAESFLGALTGLLSTLVIGRLITPVELGRAGAALAVIGLVEIATAIGIGDALVRSRSIHTTLTDTAFVGLVALSLAGAALCCVLAVPLAWLYHDRGVGVLLAVSSLLVPLAAIDTVPVALLTRKMRLDVLARRGVLSKLATLLSAAGLAYAGCGAWAIVGSTFVGSALATLCLAGTMQRWPRLRLDWAELRSLVAFGAPISLEQLLLSVTTRLFSLLFGVFHGLDALGYLQFAQRLIDEIANVIQNFALRFGLSYFAGVERAGGNAAAAFLQGTRMVALVAAPVLLGFAAVSPDALAAVIGPRWLPATGFIVVAALGWSLVLPTVLVSPVLRARGVQRPLVATSALGCCLALSACVATANAVVEAAVLASGARHLLALPAAVWMTCRHLGVAPRRYVAAFAAPLGCALLMAALVWVLRDAMQGTPPLPRLLLCIGTGAVVYVPAVLGLDRTLLGSMRPLAIRWLQHRARLRVR